MSGIEVIELIGIICVTVVILALVYVTKIKCTHDWEKVDKIAYYDNSYSKYPIYHKYVYHSKKCKLQYKKILNVLNAVTDRTQI